LAKKALLYLLNYNSIIGLFSLIIVYYVKLNYWHKYNRFAISSKLNQHMLW